MDRERIKELVQANVDEVIEVYNNLEGSLIDAGLSDEEAFRTVVYQALSFVAWRMTPSSANSETVFNKMRSRLAEVAEEVSKEAILSTVEQN